jgi:hypothetical protein
LEFGEHALEFFEPVHHPVVFCVVDEHFIALVIGVAEFEDARRQPAGLIVRGIKVRRGVGLCHGTSVGAAGDIRRVRAGWSGGLELVVEVAF